MLTKISKLHLSYSTKSCRHALSPNEKILRHIYFFVAFCNNGHRQREPCLSEFSTRILQNRGIGISPHMGMVSESCSYGLQ